jgi:hypothetical protein
MKSRFLAGAAACFLALALISPDVAFPNTRAPANQPAPQAAPAKRERHPAIHRAIRQLERAKQILQQEAARDFEGHRAKAVQDIDQALAELHRALQADKK